MADPTPANPTVQLTPELLAKLVAIPPAAPATTGPDWTKIATLLGILLTGVVGNYQLSNKLPPATVPAAVEAVSESEKRIIEAVKESTKAIEEKVESIKSPVKKTSTPLPFNRHQVPVRNASTLPIDKQRELLRQWQSRMGPYYGGNCQCLIERREYERLKRIERDAMIRKAIQRPAPQPIAPVPMLAEAK